ncbi:hypothetical protein COCVIDRAFT_19541 [Bipolaris victoriae FI3]|uniref:Uncharacterized protein n=1 Tax=Bipolaris victoriae (strain FI3) TaxID=930091 RepID=W7E6N0_BIPV3|nr:hypothetical protein COCVIDRAFT_19541 [Bipolaris victoriae FI3]
MADIDAGNLFNVKGLVAVVTGGGTGIGLMIAQALEANGAIVYILGRREEVLKEATATAKHGNIHYFKADVTSKPDLAAAAEHIAAKTGYVNVVVANSGIIGPTMRYLKDDATLKETQDYLWNWDSDEFNQAYNVNVNGAFFTAIAFLELLDKGNKAKNVEQDSQFICVSSAGAFSRVLMSGFAYAGSKAAVIHITKQLATRLVPFGIRCNVLAPGLYPSEITADMNFKESYPREFLPQQRVGDRKDMAGALLFLTSRAGAYINGNVLLTDGGRLSVLPATY